MSHTWMIPTYNTRTWSYKEAPEAGDRVHYVNDKLSSNVQTVRWDRIVMNDGSIYRRRGNIGRMWTWIHRAVTTKSFESPSNPAPLKPQLRPFRPAHYVHVVNL